MDEATVLALADGLSTEKESSESMGLSSLAMVAVVSLLSEQIFQWSLPATSPIPKDLTKNR